MKAIQIREHGGPERLELCDIDAPTPGDGEALVTLGAAGVNFIDTYQREGLYKVTLPFVPGMEGAGEVLEVGPNVNEVAVGDRVAYAMTPGSYAEQTVVPAAKLVRIPEGVSTELAAAVMLQGMTAHYLSHSTYGLKEGDACLVHAAAGGVGLLLVQMAKERGAYVFGTVSTEEKEALARGAGADEVIRYTEEDFEEAVKDLTDGRGVQVVYDSVGKTTFEKSLNCLEPRGLLALFGQSSGPVGDFDPQVLNAKGSLYLTRPSLGHYVQDRGELLWRAGDVLRWVGEGKLEVRVDSSLPLADAAEVHRKLEGRETAGKVLLVP